MEPIEHNQLWPSMYMDVCNEQTKENAETSGTKPN